MSEKVYVQTIRILSRDEFNFLQYELKKKDENIVLLPYDVKVVKPVVIMCKDCVYNPYNKPVSVDVVHGTPERCWDLASRINAFCSEAKREEE
jgi:hypothetical protein